jgi:hypothetical protein
MVMGSLCCTFYITLFEKLKPIYLKKIIGYRNGHRGYIRISFLQRMAGTQYYGGVYMRKLICKNCGNAEFILLGLNEKLCKCGRRLTKLSDYRWEETRRFKEIISERQRRQAEMVSRISLLKREIDQCLDLRDKERFQKLSAELKACETVVKNGGTYVNHSVRLKEKLTQNNDIV